MHVRNKVSECGHVYVHVCMNVCACAHRHTVTTRITSSVFKPTHADESLKNNFICLATNTDEVHVLILLPLCK